jgi:hypothetical protein
MPKTFSFPKRPAAVPQPASGGNDAAVALPQPLAASSGGNTGSGDNISDHAVHLKTEHEAQGNVSVHASSPKPATQATVQELDPEAVGMDKLSQSSAGNSGAVSQDTIGQSGLQNANKELSVEEEALLLRQCRLSKVELIEAALESGRVSIDFVFSSGDTLLITACKSGFKRLAKIFVQRGCALNAVDLDGNTAAHWCFASDFPQLGEYLISKGASDTIVNKNGLTCRQLMLKPSAAQGILSSTDGNEYMPPNKKVPTLATNGKDTSFPPINRALVSDPRPNAKYTKNGASMTKNRRKHPQAKPREETPYERMYGNVRAQSTPPVLQGHNRRIDGDEAEGSTQRNLMNDPSLSPIGHHHHAAKRKDMNLTDGKAHHTHEASGHHVSRGRSPLGGSSAADVNSPRSTTTATNTRTGVESMFAGKMNVVAHTEDSSLKTLENFDQSPLPEISRRRSVAPSASMTQRRATAAGGDTGNGANAEDNRDENSNTQAGNKEEAVAERGVSAAAEHCDAGNDSATSNNKNVTVGKTGSVASLSKWASVDGRKTAHSAEVRIDSPRSIEALKRLGVHVEELLEVPLERIMRQVKDKKLAEIRYKLYEERRQSLLARCREERIALMARSRDASLNVLFAEFSKVI